MCIRDRLLLWAVGSALLIASKEYGIYVFVALLVIFIALTLRIRHNVTSKALLTSLFLAPFTLIYLWDFYHLGLTIEVLAKILGSGLLISIAFLCSGRILNYVFQVKRTENSGGLGSIVVLSIISLPSLLYYIVFALKYGVVGSLRLTGIQQRFIPENILILIAPFLEGAKPRYNIMNFFAYDRILRSIGGFVAIGSFLILVPLIYIEHQRKRRDYSSLNLVNDKLGLKILSLLALTVIFYYIGAVNISQTLVIAGFEYRRILPLIAILNTIIPVAIHVYFGNEGTKKIETLVSIWILANITLHMGTVNILEIPYSYLVLTNPQKTFVSSDILAVFFSLLLALTWITLILSNEELRKRFKSATSQSVKLVSLVFVIMLVFTNTFIIGFLANHVSKHTFDPKWYDTIYSSITYSFNWGTQWVKVYELLKDRQNSIILIEEVYPFAYFLNRSVVVYGNPAATWFTTHALLAKLMNYTDINHLYVIRNKCVRADFAEKVFNLIRKIVETDNITEMRTLSTILSSSCLEVLEMKTFKLVYEVNYSNVTFLTDEKATKYRILSSNLVEWTIISEQAKWYVFTIALPQPLNLSGQCLLSVELTGDDSENWYQIELEDSSGNTRYLCRELMNWHNTKILTLLLGKTVAEDYPESFNLTCVTEIKISYMLKNKTELNRILIGSARFYCPRNKSG